MSTIITTDFTIEKINKTKISEVDFENLNFGSVFTDHMFECDFIDDQWVNPTIRPYQPISVAPSLKAFHYGQAVFEGMKAYKDTDGKVWMFRPDENQERINKSAKRLAMPEFPKEWFMKALDILLKMDSEWVKPGLGNALYIRPFMIAIQNEILATPSDSYKFMIILSPVQSYFKGAVGVEIARHFSRSANGGVGAAKAAGNYAGQFYPTNLAREKGYQQVIWTDASTHEYLEEAGTMNVFFRINDTLITAPTSDRILDGITRKSIIQLAKHKGIDVDVRKITVTELIKASNNGSLKEIFGTGTAAVVSPINKFAFDDVEYPINDQDDCYADKIKKMITDIQYNRAEDPFNWRYQVKL